jgi:hypothetical protein
VALTSMKYVVLIAFAMLIAGCDRGVPLSGPIAIGAAPVHVTFATAVTPAGHHRAVCLEFDRPGDSQRASEVTVVLLATQGERDTMNGRLDRAGESTVCLRDTSAIAMTHTYAGAELSARSELRIRGISWAAPRIRP